MKKLISVFMIIIMLVSLSGCRGSKNELNKLAVVIAIGFDLTPDNKYIFTAQILNPQKEPSSAMGMPGKRGQQASSDVIVLSSMGSTPEDAISHMSTELGKTLFFGHSKCIVIGKTLAESDLTLFTDSTLRSYESRPDNPLFVTQGNASDIIKAVPMGEKIPANAIENLINQQSSYGYASIVSRLDFANAFSNKSSAPITGLINLQKNSTGSIFDMSGTAVFKSGKLIGVLNMNETRGLQWIKGNVQEGSITSYIKDKGIVTFDILNSKSVVKPLMIDGKLNMQISISVESNIVEMSAPLDPIKYPETMDMLGRVQDEAIEKEIRVALNTAQKKYNADIFDFNGIIHRDNPGLWNSMKKSWDHIYPYLNVEIIINSKVRRPGTISKPIE